MICKDKRLLKIFCLLGAMYAKDTLPSPLHFSMSVSAEVYSMKSLLPNYGV